MGGSSSRRQRGFTLTELLIALAIIGAMGALALPALGRLMDRTRARLQREGVEQQLDALPQAALRQGRTLVLQSGAPAVLDLPAGWAMSVAQPVTYRFDGVCSGGRVRFAVGDTALEYALAAPACRVTPGGAG